MSGIMQVMINASKILCFAMTMILVMVSDNYAQICQEEGFDIVTQLREVRQYNNNNSVYSDKLIYKIAAIFGESAIPELRKLVADTNISSFTRRYTNIALAKLGDDAAMNEFIAEADKDSGYGDIRSLAFIANDKAVSSLMESIIKNYGKSKYVTPEGFIADMLPETMKAVRTISYKRNLPDLPSSNDGKEWIQWWEKNKNMDIGRPAYEDVENPTLKCFARKVEWGIYSALLSIADYGGADAVATLRKFQRRSNAGDSYGYLLGSFFSNRSIALAKLGDQQEFDEIVDGLRNRQSYDDLLEKLRYIGDIRAVGALIETLDILYNETMWKKDATGRYKGITGTLNTLAQMVQNAPLGYGAEPTEENVNIWKEWWKTRRDIAVIIPYNPYNRQQR